MSIPERARRKPGETEELRTLEPTDTIINIKYSTLRGQHSGARVSNSTDTATGAGVDTTLSFDTVRYDTDNYYDPTTPTKLWIPFSGFYLVWAGNVWDNASGGYRRNGLMVDGTRTIAIRSNRTEYAHPATGAQTIVFLQGGQYVENFVTSETAANVLSVATLADANDTVSPEFSVNLLGVFQTSGSV